jgi:hypothetical protein
MTPPGFTRAGKPDGYGIGLGEVLARVTMQVFVRDHCTMVATSVHGDVDGIPQGSHDAKSTADGVAWQTMPFTPAALRFVDARCWLTILG